MDHLDVLESQSVYILREAYRSFKQLVMLWSIGKDSTVLLWLARKAFFGHVPMPLLHIDTSHKIPKMIEYRDRFALQWHLHMIVGRNEQALAARQTFPDGAVTRLECCRLIKSEALKHTLSGEWPRWVLDHRTGQYDRQEGGEPFTGVIVGARSDEEGSRSKERYFSPRDQHNEWDVGDQIVSRSAAMPWYEGPTLLEALDGFHKLPSPVDQALRMPVQDVYRFTEQGDDRRIVAGRIETGRVRVGDEVVLVPSGKRTRVATIETFNCPTQDQAQAGQCTGLTFAEEIYVRPGEVLCKASDTPALSGTQLKVNLFWMGRRPMVPDQRYKLKCGTASVPVWLRSIEQVLDASDLTTVMNRRQIERHDVAECMLETLKGVAFDRAADIPPTGRFVIIDHYEIAGGGVIMDAVSGRPSRVEERVQARERWWERSRITPAEREARLQQGATLVLICGAPHAGKQDLAKRLDEGLFARGRFVYYLGLSNGLLGMGLGAGEATERDETLRRLGEVSHLFTDAGLILITTISGLDDYELDLIRTLNQPSDCLVVRVGQGPLGADRVHLQLDDVTDLSATVVKIEQLLAGRKYLPEYYL